MSFLWRFPWGFPRWTLSSTLLYGVRTFLESSTDVRPRDYPGCLRSIRLLGQVALAKLVRERCALGDREVLREMAGCPVPEG